MNQIRQIRTPLLAAALLIVFTISACTTESAAVQHNLTITTQGSGTVAAAPEGPYDSGTVVTLTATPESGWSFQEWTGDLSGNANPASITLDADKAVTAVFSPPASTTACSDPAEIVTFEDSAVEAAVRSLFGLPAGREITCAEVQVEVPSVVAPDGQETANALLLGRCDPEAILITSLAGLRHLTSLVRLDLSCNELTDPDLQELSTLGALEELDLDVNNLSDLSPLASLTNLEVLGLFGNQVQDLTPLAGLTNLRVLYASANAILDLEPLADLSSLEHLWLLRNCLSNLEGSSETSCLSDISALAGLTNLVALLIESNDVVDIGVVTNFGNLELLDASANQIAAISALSALQNLRTVELDDNPLHSLAPLATNLDFADGREPFEYARGTATLPIGASVYENLRIGFNCIMDDPAWMNQLATLDDRDVTIADAGMHNIRGPECTVQNPDSAAFEGQDLKLLLRQRQGQE